MSRAEAQYLVLLPELRGVVVGYCELFPLLGVETEVLFLLLLFWEGLFPMANTGAAVKASVPKATIHAAMSRLRIVDISSVLNVHDNAQISFFHCGELSFLTSRRGLDGRLRRRWQFNPDVFSQVPVFPDLGLDADPVSDPKLGRLLHPAPFADHRPLEIDPNVQSLPPICPHGEAGVLLVCQIDRRHSSNELLSDRFLPHPQARNHDPKQSCKDYACDD